MKVLLADSLAPIAMARLKAAGHRCVVDGALKGDALSKALAEVRPDVLVVRSTRVEAEHAAAADSLSLVIRAGAGVNTIALDACARRGIYVANCPGKNAVAVAELTMGLILAIDRHIPDATAALREGRWDKKTYSEARGLAGRTLGVIGTGDIGREVVTRARGFGMKVVAWSRSLDDEAAAALGVRRLESPEAVAAACDVLTVHLALNAATRGRIGASVFEALKPDAIFVNTSRAEVVDEAALLAALDRGLRAGLDVYSDEPSGSSGDFEHPLARHPRVVGTHHTGASTDQAQEAVALEVFRIIDTFHRTGRVPNCVDLAERTSADHTLVVRHRDRVGVLAEVLVLLREAGINVQEMDNTIFAGGYAACARIQVHGAPSDALLARIREGEDVFGVVAIPLEGGEDA